MANEPNQQLMRMTPTAGAVVREGFDSTEMSVSADIQTMAMAAQQEAEVKARWAIAQRNPRDWDVVRTKMMAECARPAFAASARYAKPIGKDAQGNDKKVHGPSIRFVEAALRCMGNVYCPTTVIAETMTERRIQVMVTDLEANISWPRQITLSKTVERQDTRGRPVVGQRVNSRGQITYTVIATEDELLTKEGAVISKAIRTAGMRLLPGWLIDEGQAACIATQAKETKENPNAAKNKVLDAFAALGIDPAAIKGWLGRPLEQIRPDELQDLREIHAALKEGETTWSEVLESKKGPVAAPSAPNSAPAAAPTAPASGESSTAAAEELVEVVIRKQKEDILSAMQAAAAANDFRSLQACGPRIQQLPEQERAELNAQYKELKAAMSAVKK